MSTATVFGPVDSPLSLAAMHLASANVNAAISSFEAALAQNPGEVQAYLGLAQCYVQQGARTTAVEVLSDAAARLTEQGSVQEAFTLYATAVAIDPGSLELHVDIAELEANNGELEAATRRLERLAETYLDLGRIEAARVVLEIVGKWTRAAAAEEAAKRTAPPPTPPPPRAARPQHEQQRLAQPPPPTKRLEQATSPDQADGAHQPRPGWDLGQSAQRTAPGSSLPRRVQVQEPGCSPSKAKPAPPSPGPAPAVRARSKTDVSKILGLEPLPKPTPRPRADLAPAADTTVPEPEAASPMTQSAVCQSLGALRPLPRPQASQ